LETYKENLKEFYKKMTDDQINAYKKELKIKRSEKRRELHNMRMRMVNIEEFNRLTLYYLIFSGSK
jgi:hypothetical protein